MVVLRGPAFWCRPSAVALRCPSTPSVLPLSQVQGKIAGQLLHLQPEETAIMFALFDETMVQVLSL